MSRAGVHAESGLNNVSPFLIQRSIDAVAGKVKYCKKLRSGQLLIQCFNGKQANKLIKILSLSLDIFVKVEEHNSLNKSKGIFYSNELRSLSDEELLYEIREQNPNVIEIKRLKRRDPESRTPTSTDIGLYITTFNVSELPDKILLGYMYTTVKPYIPNPLRCFKCFQFGHVSDECKSQVKICPHCSNIEHTPIDETGKREKCNKEAKCVNCQQPHNSFSKQCAIYKREYDIQKIKVTQKKTLTEARKEYDKQNQLPTTYANAVKPCNCKCKCQEETKTINTNENEKEKITADFTIKATPNSPVRQIVKLDGSKIDLLPKNISKRKKRELTSAEKKMKDNSTKALSMTNDSLKQNNEDNKDDSSDSTLNE
ncbi:uncharacterized protein LOC135963013 [Calliphora vicina]|uniref:uncharacterized protein LOC135963013 n=1 Tax=Calliphora vicina TaxID=7373 RepID=UPI00325BA071